MCYFFNYKKKCINYKIYNRQRLSIVDSQVRFWQTSSELFSGWYTIFVVAWTLPTIQNPALGKLTLRIIMSGIGMGAVQGAVSLRILVSQLILSFQN